MLQRKILGLAGAIALMPALLIAAPTAAVAGATGPAAPPVIQDEGCSSSEAPFGYIITDVYKTCTDCKKAGRAGVSEGSWLAFHCRRISTSTLLYTKV